jgi:hypothetical protein
MPKTIDHSSWLPAEPLRHSRRSLHLADLAAKVPEAVGRHQSASCTLPAEAGDFEGSCAIAAEGEVAARHGHAHVRLIMSLWDCLFFLRRYSYDV